MQASILTYDKPTYSNWVTVCMLILHLVGITMLKFTNTLININIPLGGAKFVNFASVRLTPIYPIPNYLPNSLFLNGKSILIQDPLICYDYFVSNLKRMFEVGPSLIACSLQSEKTFPNQALLPKRIISHIKSDYPLLKAEVHPCV